MLFRQNVSDTGQDNQFILLLVTAGSAALFFLVMLAGLRRSHVRYPSAVVSSLEPSPLQSQKLPIHTIKEVKESKTEAEVKEKRSEAKGGKVESKERKVEAKEEKAEAKEPVVTGIRGGAGAALVRADGLANVWEALYDGANPCEVFLDVFREAKQLYDNESRFPYTESKLGGEFGFFSWARHKGVRAGFEERFQQCLPANVNESMKVAIQLLTDKGSLWDLARSNTHSFNNYFLRLLRVRNIKIYREVVEAVYKVKFIEGSIVLYRRDSRAPFDIFHEGFKLKNSPNRPEARKLHYVNPVTRDYGISFSKYDPPLRFGNFVYTIVLPKNHNLLLVDIVGSPRNLLQLTSERIRLGEVNSLDNIPACYIQHCIEKRPGHADHRTINPHFSSETVLTPRSFRYRGCY